MNARRFFHWMAPFFALGLVVLTFSLITTPDGDPVRDFFLTWDNGRFIASQGIVIGLGAIGMTLVLLSGGIDLSAGAVAALSGVVAAMLLQMEVPPLLAIGAAVLAGGGFGMLNGSLVAMLKVAPFVVTLGTLGMARGVTRWMSTDTPITVSQGLWVEAWVAPVPPAAWMGVAPGVFVVLLLGGLLMVLLRGTIYGRHLYAIGSNEAAATLCGVRVRLTKVLAYSLAGLFFGMAGVAQMAILHQGNPTGSPGLGLDLIAAAVIGGVKLGGGVGNIPGALLGALTMTVLQNGCQQAGWPVPLQEIAIGGAIVAAAGLDRLRYGKL